MKGFGDSEQARTWGLKLIVASQIFEGFLTSLLFLYETCTARSRQDQQRQTDTEALLEQMMVGPIDPWSDADMKSVILYLRGNKHLECMYICV